MKMENLAAKCFKMKAKKSQLQIQEMAFMLVAVVLFFGLIAMFALSIMYQKIYDSANQIAKDKLIASITNIADTPEFRCVTSKSNCIDEDKLVSILNKTKYKEYWPFSSMRVVKYSAFNKEEENMIECNFANYPDCEVFVVKDDKEEDEEQIENYAVLCRKEYDNGYTYDKCETAKVILGKKIITKQNA
jgi:hypothetical protein